MGTDEASIAKQTDRLSFYRLPENAVSRDVMLANIALYWFSGARGSSFRPYCARLHRPWPVPAGATIDLPMGYLVSPKEILRPPRSLAANLYRDIRAFFGALW